MDSQNLKICEIAAPKHVWIHVGDLITVGVSSESIKFAWDSEKKMRESYIDMSDPIPEKTFAGKTDNEFELSILESSQLWQLITYK